jgi:hypothetical protein
MANEASVGQKQEGNVRVAKSSKYEADTIGGQAGQPDVSLMSHLL